MLFNNSSEGPVLERVSIAGKYHLACHLFGDSKNPPLFCVHGLTRNARDFDFVAFSLVDRFFVISVDMPGRGDSDWVDSSFYSYNNYLADMSFLIKKYFSFESINWLGTSMGGIIGMTVAAKHPNLIKKLILNDIGTNLPRKSLERIAKYVGANPKFNNFDEAKKHLKILLNYFGIKKEDHWDYITKYSIRKEKDYFVLNYDPKISVIFKEATPSKEDICLKDIWAKVNAEKILVIKGDKSDILLQEDLEYMLNSKKNISSYILQGVGHAPALMSEEEIKIINSFL
jgi:pimeloyl-ACP methyl ester carboxylesterase